LEIDRGYVEEVDDQKLFEAAVESMLATLDPYTEFEGEQLAQDMREVRQGGREGGRDGCLDTHMHLLCSPSHMHLPSLPPSLPPSFHRPSPVAMEG
jgi:hypothetical protein